MTTEPPLDNSDDDAFEERVLPPLNLDAAPPDGDRVADLCAQAGDVFASLAADRTPQPTPPKRANTNTTKQGIRTMLTFVKPLSVLAASIGFLLLAWFGVPGPASADVTLGDVLDRVSEAESLQLEVHQDGNETQVLVAGDSVRWQDTPQQYRIASGSRLWKVDEAAKTVTGDVNPWATRDGKEIDLLALIGGQTSQELRSVRATEQTEHAGTLCNVFIFHPAAGNARHTVRAFADAKTHQLYSIGAWKRGITPGAEPPIAELRLVKKNVDFDESLFVVGGNLADDGRIGKVLETQGIVQIRPKTHRRWTPIYGPITVKPGDWIRTDVRGANAVSIGLTSGYRMILGPGTLMEITQPTGARLHRGEVNVTGSKKADASLEISARPEQSAVVAAGERAHIEIDRSRELVRRDAEPKWLAGFLGATSDESIGSLITKIDGRDVPLTVGYHKVKVEIRDQIARTTIEESFVNHTQRRLEGQFHFPLPQDASISGFGMWIGGELIEADVVEKQRAREIYETILREKRDPGLLEWAGGNIFKARVFPIEAHSEKRIKIVYTQVLPMRANKYRYSYGLRSEMLQTTPLRELSLEVLVNSALRLKTVDCPTHTVRTDLTPHSASVEFSAQEYTPERDFEVICEVDEQESDVIVVPHQRGDDGYFLAQITPPSPAGNWQREILPDGDPVTVLLVCDTSGSMDRAARESQQQFVTSILSALSNEDTFNIAFCDVDTQWQQPNAVGVTERSATSATDWLADRQSLGWTDLDRMIKTTKHQLASRPGTKNTHVIYVGDGIATARDASPQAFVNRLRRTMQDTANATFHAVSIGSSFESGVLKGIASVGGGSVRHIDGEQTPQRTAHELLNEITQPGLTDIKVEFQGLDVAAVYPAELPNLAAGTQQIVIGRYLPTGDDQSGEIIITGQRNGEAVRYASRITMKEAEDGNSFIPRLWARAHLERLLEQGSSQFLRDEVIALSEEFHIMTPYTSLLVLESDEDRERFGVKRRFQMRDGERFFADGRSNASFELLQQQMKAAGNWRLELRQRILRNLTKMGRGPLRDAPQNVNGFYPVSGGAMMGRAAGSGGFGGGGGFGGAVSMRGRLSIAGTISDESGPPGMSQPMSMGSANGSMRYDFDAGGNEYAWAGESDKERSIESAQRQLLDVRGELEAMDDVFYSDVAMQQAAERPGRMNTGGRQFPAFNGFAMKRLAKKKSVLSSPAYREQNKKLEHIGASQYTTWARELFPAPPAAPRIRGVVESAWPVDAQQVAQALVQPITLTNGRGITVTTDQEVFNVRWNFLANRTHVVQLYDTKRWLAVPNTVGSHNIIEWCDSDRRVAVSSEWQLGRSRKATENDLSTFHPGDRAHATRSLAQTYATWNATVTKNADGQTILALRNPRTDIDQSIEVVVDPERSVVLRFEVRNDGKVSSVVTYDDYVQAAGCWWPQTITRHDDQHRITSRKKQAINVLSAQDFATRFSEESPKADEVRIVYEPLPTIAEARTADASATAGFDEYLILLLDACRIQNWDSALAFLEKLEAVAPEGPGPRWIRQRVLVAARRNERARQAFLETLKKLAATSNDTDLYIANQVITHARQIVDHNELLQVLDTVRPIFERQPDYARANQRWQQHRVDSLRPLGRLTEAVGLQQTMAATAPWDTNAQTAYALLLSETGEHEQGVSWLKQQIARDVERTDYELQQLSSICAQILRGQYMLNELIPFLQSWVAKQPSGQTAYDRYLSALVLANRVTEADEKAEQWLTDSLRPGKLKTHELSRLRSAINFAIGQRYQSYSNWMDTRWRQPLLKVALHFITHEHHFDVTGWFIGHHLFRQTQEAHKGRDTAANLLKNSAGDIPAVRISPLIDWTINTNHLSTEDWHAIAATIRKRWDAEDEATLRHTLGSSLIRIYSKVAPTELHLKFVRRRMERAIEEQDTTVIETFTNALFDTLLDQTWSEVHETEAFDLLTELSVSDDAAIRLTTWIDRLQQLTDRMLERRLALATETLQADGHPNAISRRELAERTRNFRQAARAGLVERLTLERARILKLADAESSSGKVRLLQELAAWVRLERMHLDVVRADTTRDNLFADDGALGPIVAECRKILGDVPHATPQEPEQDDKVNYQLNVIQQLRQERAMTMLSNLTLRRSAPQQLQNDLMAYIENGMTLPKDDADFWKMHRMSMLVALDRPKDLERDLRTWIRGADYPAPLQLVLARLLAEQGRISDAITLVEIVQRTETLSPSDHIALANWYMVADRRDDYRRARIETFKAMQEYRIFNWISQKQQPWTRSGSQLPPELDENVLYAFQALFEKSNSPGNYVYQLRSFYAACRDFRLLKMVPDAVVGRTPQQVYSFLSQLENNLLEELRNEAAADELIHRLNEVRDNAETVIDKRALDLLEAMVERRSSEVLNQPGPHAAAAITAMRRAFDREWGDGEIEQMASLLSRMGTIHNPGLAKERLRELRELHRLADPGSDPHFNISWHLAAALANSHQNPNEALSVMEVALRAYHADNPGGLPARLNTPLDGYIGLLEQQRQHAAAEAVLQSELKMPVNTAQKFWLKQRLNLSYLHGYARKAQISLGQGTDLYHNLLTHLLGEAQSPHDSYHYQTMSHIITLFRNEQRRDKTTYKADVKRYAFEQFPKLLRPHDNNYHTLVEQAARLVKDLVSTRDGLAFVIDRLETYPARFESTWQNPWRQLGDEAAQWRAEAKNASDLEPRLLKLALTRLRRDLISGEHHHRHMMHKRTSYFWQEKEADFARVADEIADEHRDSGQIVGHVAYYLYHRLDHQTRAVELLLDAHEREVLSVAQQIELVDMLHHLQRWGESVPLLQPIVRDYPNEMKYRTRLLEAYHGSDRTQNRDTLLTTTESHFREYRLWNESNIARLANSVRSMELYEQAVTYFDEAIKLRQRTSPTQGIDDGPLSEYYQSLARCHAHLGNTVKAVDAAAAGIVAWGRRHHQRVAATGTLKSVIISARDRNGLIRHLDQQATETGSDSALIRKTLGVVLGSIGQHDKAVTQLKIAIELQPTDSETHEALIKAYDALKRTDEATQQILTQLNFDRHNLKLYKQLAKRLGNDEALAERAATSLVEAAPLEADHHQALAELRQDQDRWSDAIVHWRHVADLREREPNGLLKLAAAQVHEKQWEDVKATLQKLNRTEWPERFRDVSNEVQSLQRQLP